MPEFHLGASVFIPLVLHMWLIATVNVIMMRHGDKNVF